MILKFYIIYSWLAKYYDVLQLKFRIMCFKKIFDFFKKKEDLTKYYPCVLTKEDTRDLSEREVVKIYSPALVNEGVVIKLSPKKSVPKIKTPEALQKLKMGLKYVWCDGFESSVWQDRKCKYLGIRITESFILHESMIKNTWDDTVTLWLNKCQGRYLTYDEFMLLTKVWDEVSQMRETAHDTPLFDYWAYWFDEKGSGYSGDKFVNKDGKVFHHSTEAIACLLMAVK